MKKAEKYEKPQALDNFAVCEPVETGCCLRSCGGSPHHMGAEKLISDDVKSKFEQAQVKEK